MIELPRIALGTVQSHVHLQKTLWALLEGLRRRGIEGQVFCSQSRFDDLGSLATVDDRRLRHLDSWLMSPEASRWFLMEGSQERDLSIVVGRFGCPHERPQGGGSLNQLCQTLQLPSVVVLDVGAVDPCCPPSLPARTSALLLTGCGNSYELARWQTQLEAFCRVPVIGALCDPDVPYAAVRRRQELSASDRERIERLGDDFDQHVRGDRLLKLARSASPLPTEGAWQPWPPINRPLRVAMAYDEIFNCYFPDTMDCLEAIGAELIDFSPLRSECLPESIDLVWLGCGHPERCPLRLSRNICFRQSLQAYVRAGGRVYAEGGGLAYICETMHCESGSYAMAGLLPAEARYQPRDVCPVDVRLVGKPWFGQQRVRGYLNPYWTITARDRCIDYSARSCCPLSLVGSERVIGSRIHLHFASQPQLLQSIWNAGGEAGHAAHA
jgi:cobyrinic acid a,c-diamide synthase